METVFSITFAVVVACGGGVFTYGCGFFFAILAAVILRALTKEETGDCVPLLTRV